MLAVRVGRQQLLREAPTPVWSSLRKSPVGGGVPLDCHGLDGDEQADKRRHGGPDKAVCVYPAEHYDFWRRALGRELPLGGFGENLSTVGLGERHVHLGDRYAIGSAVVEVSMPRRPCFKLGLAHGRQDLPLLVQSTGRTGFYLRVPQPGLVTEGDRIVMIERPAGSLSVADVNRVVNVDKHDLDSARRVMDCRHVPLRWRQALERRLCGDAEDDTLRLHGSRTDDGPPDGGLRGHDEAGAAR